VRIIWWFARRATPRTTWGNLLLFDDPPIAGDAARWEELLEAEFGGEQDVRHRTFAWGRVDGVGTPNSVRPHRRESRTVRVRALDPTAAVDEELWEQVLELQVAGRDERRAESEHRAFARRRLDDLRALFEIGRGAWCVALDQSAPQLLASCGVVVTGTRGRFRAVDTAASYRRRGICSRLVVEAARRAAAHHQAQRFVIAADPNYHALGLYESLGFRRAERVCGTCRRPA
jgi:ribosomal protein S18 acetylase RimI-like enzyme